MIRSPDNAEAELAELDQRVERLESAVTALSDTKLMEDRVADRVANRLNRDRVPSDSAAPTAGYAPPEQRGWFLSELWNECRYFVQMMSDHRYPYKVRAMMGPFVFLCAYYFIWQVIGSIPTVGPVVERIVDVVLAVILYKYLSREVARYRSMFPGR